MSGDFSGVSGGYEPWTLWEWPFFDDSHYELADRVVAWSHTVHELMEDPDLAARGRAIVRSLGDAGLLKYVVPETVDDFDVRALCVIREALTYDEALSDAMFTMQGIGTLALQQHGTDAQKAKYLQPCRDGSAVAAFALTEPRSGSDAAATETSAERDGNGFVINGEKTLISNAGFADHYVVIARTGEDEGARGLSAFIVDADTPGLECGEAIDFIAEHPAAGMTFTDCRVDGDALIGEAGQGFRVAMGAFDIFRPSVGAAAMGLARRAMLETLNRVQSRQMFGEPMGNMQSIQMTLADMATDIDTGALAVYRAAWARDVRGDRESYGPSMAKLAAAEAAGRVADKAVQLCGGMGVTRGSVIEKLYREARPMRIYEGASEVQKIIIGRSLLRGNAQP